jgi:hypothetical protein
MKKMDLMEVVAIALDRELATQEELDHFTTQWRDMYNNGEEGFGDETRLEDWIGGALTRGVCSAICWRRMASAETYGSIGQDLSGVWNGRIEEGRCADVTAHGRP